jgi:putative ABC transport system permease protein
MALGADRAKVLKMVMRQGMTLALVGVVMGVVGSYWLTKYLESKLDLKSMLYGVKVSDPMTYGVIALILTVVAVVACYIPARRATRVDPMVALRYE